MFSATKIIALFSVFLHQNTAFSFSTLNHQRVDHKSFLKSDGKKRCYFGLEGRGNDGVARQYNGNRLDTLMLKNDDDDDEFTLVGNDEKLELSKISSVKVSTLSGDDVSLGSLLLPDDGSKKTSILVCLSHFGDFNAWEVAQQYIASFSTGDLDSECNVVLVGIGSVASANKFADDLDLAKESRIQLVADETGAVTEVCGCYKGWLAIDKEHAKKWPAADVNPYIKLFGMIFGIGSPGTIGRVLYGYVGDKEGDFRSRKWVVDALLTGTSKGRFPKITSDAFEGVPEESGLRPFELATLRAQTGIHIVLNWGKLGPTDGDLFTRMGGTFVFRDRECIYEYYDKGILTYAPMSEVYKAARKN